MAKLVYLSAPAHGHLNPALPVVRELTRRGEQIVLYNTAEFAPQIEQAGARFVPYPPSELTSDCISTLLQDGNLAQITRLLLRVSETLVPFTLEVLAQERPDAVLFDAIALWGYVAAKCRRLPTIATIPHLVFDGRKLIRKTPHVFWTILGWMPALPGLFAARKKMQQRYGSYMPQGRRLFPMRGELSIMFTSRDLQPSSPLVDASFRFAGPSIDLANLDATLPFARREDLPLVYISLGTIHNRSPSFYQACFTAFQSFPAQFVLSAGAKTDLASLGSVPPNFIVRKSVPQLSVLSAASAFVTHAGMNSVHEGLYFGVPLLLVPQQFEQLFNARVVEAQGAGLVIDDQITRRRATATALQRGLKRLMTDESYRSRAQHMRSHLRSTGGFQEAANEIQLYLERVRGQPREPEVLATPSSR